MKKNHRLQKEILAACIVLVGCAGAVSLLYNKQPQDIEEEPLDPNVQVLSAEAYEKMEIGMSPEEVLEIAEIEPCKNYTSQGYEGTITTVQWHATPGPNVYSVIFIDNKLDHKDFIDVIKLKEEAQKN